MQQDFHMHSQYVKNSQEYDFKFYKFENDERIIETSSKIIIADFYS